jgi:hypothetical protein
MKTTLDLSDAVLERAKAHALRRYLESLESGAATRRTFRIEPWGEGGLLPEYRDKSWNEILDEVNTVGAPDDRG